MINTVLTFLTSSSSSLSTIFSCNPKIFTFQRVVFYSESDSMLPIAFNPLGLFLDIFFSLTSYRSRVRSHNHAPGLTRLRVRWMNLARFLGLWGSLEPLIAMKSSSFSLLVKAMTNFGGHTTLPAPATPASPLPPDDEPPPPPPFLLSCAVSDEAAADLL